LNTLLKSQRSTQSQANSTGNYALLTDGFLAAPGGKWYVVTVYTQYPQFDANNPTTQSPINTRHIVRLNNDGSVDSSFGNQGVVTQELSITDAARAGEYSATIGPDGSIYILKSNLSVALPIDTVGPTTTDATLRVPDYDPNATRDAVFTMTKFRADGTLDTTFGTNGSREIKPGFQISIYGNFTPDVRVQADGSMILSGMTTFAAGGYGSLQPYILKLTPQGTPDTTFGTNGQVVWPSIPGVNQEQLSSYIGMDGSGNVASFIRQSLSFGSTLQSQADGTVTGVLLSSGAPTADKTTPKGYAFRVLTNGQFDPAFGQKGLVAITSDLFLDSSLTSFGRMQMLAAPGGGYLLVGNSAVGYTLQKLTATGATDTSFGRNGFAAFAAPYQTLPVQVVNGQPVITLPAGGTFGRFQFAGPNTLIAGGYLNTSTDGNYNQTLKASFVRIDLDAPTPELPTVPKADAQNAYDTAIAQLTANNLGQILADMDGDGKLETIRYEKNQDGGTKSRISIVSGATGKLIVGDVQLYESTYSGGLVVATGDIDGDGQDELIVSPDVGGAARIQVFKLVSGNLQQVDNFFGIDDDAFRGGARIALSDLNADGKADLIVSAGPGGGPRVAIFDGASLGQPGQRKKLQADFFAYTSATDIQLRNGVNIATTDINNDGTPDLLLGAGEGGGPRLTIWSGKTLGMNGAESARQTPLEDTFVGGDTTSRSGVKFLQKFAIPDTTSGGDLDDVVVINNANNANVIRGASKKT
jgi:uncharacterized delta-60 repeat protein